MVRAEDPNGLKFFFEGEKGAERMVREEFPSGNKWFFEGGKGAERKVRTELPSGEKWFFEGEKGTERQVRREFAGGEKWFFEGEWGAERVVCVEFPDGDNEFFEGEKGFPSSSSLDERKGAIEERNAVAVPPAPRPPHAPQTSVPAPAQAPAPAPAPVPESAPTPTPEPEPTPSVPGYHTTSRKVVNRKAPMFAQPSKDKALLDEKQESDDDDDESTKEVMQQYVSVVARVGGEHPVPLTQSAQFGIARTVATDVAMTKIQPELLQKKDRNDGTFVFSNAQLDVVVAIQTAHEKKSALLLGDATGVGKTRSAQAVILNQRFKASKAGKMKHEKPKVLVLSKHSLADAFRNEAESIGFKQIAAIKTTAEMEEAQKSQDSEYEREKPIDHNVRELFVAHTMLELYMSKCNLSEWLSDGLDQDHPAILVVDEIHELKSNNSRMGNAAKKLISEAHASGVMILLMSATFASEVGHLENFAPALGLVQSVRNPHSPFKTFEELQETVAPLGSSGLETVALQLCHNGNYMARSLSMDGVEFEIDEMSEPDQAISALWDKSAALWKDMKEGFKDVLSLDSLNRQYGGAMLAFFRMLNTYNRIEHTVKLTKDAIERGEQVVVTTVSTGESAIDRAAASEDGGLGGALLDGILMLLAEIKKHAHSKLVGEGKHTDAANLSNLLDACKTRAVELQLPTVPPIDLFMHKMAVHFGTREKLTELTGRKKCFKCDICFTGQFLDNWTISSIPQTTLSTRIDAFQRGDALVAILSEAASTGCSLHDINGRRRVMIPLELPWTAEKATQVAGRTHRAGQLSAPKTILISCSAIAAELRFVATIAARMRNLGATTAGDGRATSKALAVADSAIFTGPFANLAAVEINRRHSLGISTPTAERLMNRCLGMGLQTGNLVMKEFQDDVDARRLQAAAEGKLEPKIKEIVLNGTSIFEESRKPRRIDGVLSKNSNIRTLVLDTGVSYDQAMAMCTGGTYMMCQSNSKPPHTSQHAVVRMSKGRAHILRPNGARSSLTVDEFRRKWRDEVRDVRNEWSTWHEKSLTICSHGKPSARCCTSGVRRKTMHVMTFPLLDHLAKPISKKQRNGCKIVRIRGSPRDVELGIVVSRAEATDATSTPASPATPGTTDRAGASGSASSSMAANLALVSEFDLQ